jgi:hypothetical protein
MIEGPLDKHPFRTLALFLALGILAFLAGLFALLGFLQGFAGAKFDSSVVNFYLLMAGGGAIFGFERWWTYELGGVNPFHDK